MGCRNGRRETWPLRAPPDLAGAITPAPRRSCRRPAGGHRPRRALACVARAGTVTMQPWGATGRGNAVAQPGCNQTFLGGGLRCTFACAGGRHPNVPFGIAMPVPMSTEVITGLRMFQEVHQDAAFLARPPISGRITESQNPALENPASEVVPQARHQGMQDRAGVSPRVLIQTAPGNEGPHVGVDRPRSPRREPSQRRSVLNRGSSVWLVQAAYPAKAQSLRPAQWRVRAGRSSAG